MAKLSDMLTLLTEMAAKPGCHLYSYLRYCIDCVPDNCRYIVHGEWDYELMYSPELVVVSCSICQRVLLTEEEAQICAS